MHTGRALVHSGVPPVCIRCTWRETLESRSRPRLAGTGGLPGNRGDPGQHQGWHAARCSWAPACPQRPRLSSGLQVTIRDRFTPYLSAILFRPLLQRCTSSSVNPIMRPKRKARVFGALHAVGGADGGVEGGAGVVEAVCLIRSPQWHLWYPPPLHSFLKHRGLARCGTTPSLRIREHMKKGDFASFVGAEPVRLSERHFDLIVEPLNDTTGNRFLTTWGGDARWFPGRRRVSRVSWKVCIEVQPMFEVTRDDNKGDSTSRACAGILRLAFGRG